MRPHVLAPNLPGRTLTHSAGTRQVSGDRKSRIAALTGLGNGKSRLAQLFLQSLHAYFALLVR
jgi:hypothetical protein